MLEQGRGGYSDVFAELIPVIKFSSIPFLSESYFPFLSKMG